MKHNSTSSRKFDAPMSNSCSSDWCPREQL